MMDIQEEKESDERLERLAETGTTKLDAKAAESFCNAADVSRLKQESAIKNQQIANLKAEVKRLQKCRDECKIDCLLEKYNEAQEQIAMLKAEKKRAERALVLAVEDKAQNPKEFEKLLGLYIQKAEES